MNLRNTQRAHDIRERKRKEAEELERQLEIARERERQYELRRQEQTKYLADRWKTYEKKTSRTGTSYVSDDEYEQWSRAYNYIVENMGGHEELMKQMYTIRDILED